MSRIQYRYLVVVLFVLFLIIYHSFSFGEEFDTIFLTIATFTFAIFTGFFISRQGSRHSSIRDKMTEFDGVMSFIYRSSGHFSDDIQKKVGEILANHYRGELESKSWAYYFGKKSTLLTDIHIILNEVISDENLSSGKSPVLTRIFGGLMDAQKIRKNLIALYEENLPISQWLLIFILTAILLVTVSLIPSQGMILASALKAAFSTAVVFVLVILAQFNRLSFFERQIGEHSAQDVLDIIGGRK